MEKIDNEQNVVDELDTLDNLEILEADDLETGVAFHAFRFSAY